MHDNNSGPDNNDLRLQHDDDAAAGVQCGMRICMVPVRDDPVERVRRGVRLRSVSVGFCRRTLRKREFAVRALPPAPASGSMHRSMHLCIGRLSVVVARRELRARKRRLQLPVRGPFRAPRGLRGVRHSPLRMRRDDNADSRFPLPELHKHDDNDDNPGAVRERVYSELGERDFVGDQFEQLQQRVRVCEPGS